VTNVQRREIDLNLDLAEGFGVWSLDNHEAEQLALASSVNLACGFHAGDPSRMRVAVEGAKRHGVAVGAHPGLPDVVGFGRRPMVLSPAEIKDAVTYQVGALRAFTRAAGIALHHVKLHGQLASQCTRDHAAARAFIEAVAGIGDELLVYHQAVSEVSVAAEELGIRVVPEFYADIPLRADGTRFVGEVRHVQREPYFTLDEIRARVVDFVRTASVEACDGGRVGVRADTISFHNDGPSGLETARAVRSALDECGVAVTAVSP
jgi:UPF0271 protein